MFDIYSAAYLGAYECINSSIQNNIIDKQNVVGWTPLMYACSSQHETIIELLLGNGASANVPGANGLTPLMIASRNGAIHVIEILLQHFKCNEMFINGADAKGWTALFHAVYMGQEEAVKLLLSKGAKANVVDINDQSVLMVAAGISEKKGNSVFRILAEVGAHCLSPRREATLIAEKYDRLPDLRSLFIFLDVEKYWKIFHDRKIGIKQFLLLTENDLKDMGIKLLGPRRKMTLAICQLGSKFDIIR